MKKPGGHRRRGDRVLVKEIRVPFETRAGKKFFFKALLMKLAA